MSWEAGVTVGDCLKLAVGGAALNHARAADEHISQVTSGLGIETAIVYISLFLPAPLVEVP